MHQRRTGEVGYSLEASGWLRKLEIFYHAHRTFVLLSAVALLIAPLAVGLYLRGRAATEREAQAVLSRADQEYYNGNISAAGTYYQDIVTRFGGTTSADLAYIGLGRAALVQGKPAEALSAFGKAMNARDPSTAAAAKRGHAAALEDSGKPADAASEYEELAQHENEEDAVSDLLAAARAFKASGKNDDARAVLARAAKDYPNTSLQRDVALALAELR
jgi:tetratricopeptide (TPR) repeat protein